LAADYDSHFTSTSLGLLLRQAVWRRLDARFASGDRVLELGCGTGEDAVHLAQRGVRVLATDVSPAMVEEARSKAALAGVEKLVEVRPLAIDELGTLSETFDGAFSNFGGLNCVADLAGVARGLAARLRPGAPLLLCVMGPYVPWEWLHLLVRCRPSEAFRRLRRGGTQWRGLTVRYPSIRRLRQDFAPGFRLTRVSAVGALLPTTELGGWARRHPRLLSSLARLERRFDTLPPLPWLADHYLAELERTAA